MKSPINCIISQGKKECFRFRPKCAVHVVGMTTTSIIITITWIMTFMILMLINPAHSHSYRLVKFPSQIEGKIISEQMLLLPFSTFSHHIQSESPQLQVLRNADVEPVNQASSFSDLEKLPSASASLHSHDGDLEVLKQQQQQGKNHGDGHVFEISPRRRRKRRQANRRRSAVTRPEDLIILPSESQSQYTTPVQSDEIIIPSLMDSVLKTSVEDSQFFKTRSSHPSASPSFGKSTRPGLISFPTDEDDIRTRGGWANPRVHSSNTNKGSRPSQSQAVVFPENSTDSEEDEGSSSRSSNPKLNPPTESGNETDPSKSFHFYSLLTAPSKGVKCSGDMKIVGGKCRRRFGR